MAKETVRVRDNATNISLEEADTEIRDGAYYDVEERERGKKLRQGLGLRLISMKR